ncbi:hemin-degrading factor [Puniceibacterium sediminis]|uniref:Putative hemin transport protein n=1 Tax=Puniceibacterium sediminis TaxID=1608407 RepID=A0A238YSP3_9RHOB|nr:ChuX/HutX family heme-like substrate-binding protein [Puniceibacterium sediminis]SNR73469.1 putative hemin transport protein [Puniceibacterium sediminis]
MALSPFDIRQHEDDAPKLRARDIAETLGISEAELVAARCGDSVTRLNPHPDAIIGAAQTLGPVMALTRNASCVIEKVGVYENYRSGDHVSMVVAEDIDLRLFTSHWCHAFAVEKDTERGKQRSLQVFDAAGDAVHKIFLRAESDVNAFHAARDALRHADQSPDCETAPRQPVEAAKGNPDKLDILRAEWLRMTDTHQFMRLTSKLRMNRLGAYRSVGAPFVRALATEAVNTMMEQVRDAGLEVMVFVGNRGCIQIHSGLLGNLNPMGPWQNVMDPSFNLHLRTDHIAEVWAVEKPTQRGPAVSVEAFDKDGMLILQVFAVGKEGRDCRAAWGDLVAGLGGLVEQQVPA